VLGLVNSRDIKFLHIEFEVNTPTIIVKESIKNWYTTYRKYIPARSLYGAIYSLLMNRGFDKNSLGKSFNVSNMYPMNQYYSHPSIPVFPKVKYVESEDIERIKGSRRESGEESREKKIKDIVRNYIKYILDDMVNRQSELSRERIASLLMDYRQGFLKEAGKTGINIGLVVSWGEDAIYCNEEECSSHPYFKIKVLESVGISPLTRSARKGLVYTYEAIAPGNKLHAFMVCRSDVCEAISKICEENSSSARIYMGRGVSKGYGELLIKKCSTTYNGFNIGEEIRGEFVSNTIIEQKLLVAMSPVIDKEYSGLMGFSSVNSLETLIYTYEYYYSWSKVYGVLKPLIKLPGHGSVVAIKTGTKTSDELLSIYIQILLNNPGLNFLIPISLYKKLLLGE